MINVEIHIDGKSSIVSHISEEDINDGFSSLRSACIMALAWDTQSTRELERHLSESISDTKAKARAKARAKAKPPVKKKRKYRAPKQRYHTKVESQDPNGTNLDIGVVQSKNLKGAFRKLEYATAKVAPKGSTWLLTVQGQKGVQHQRQVTI